MCDDNWRSAGEILAGLGLLSAKLGKVGGCAGSMHSRPSAGAPEVNTRRGFRGEREDRAPKLVWIVRDGHHGTSPRP